MPASRWSTSSTRSAPSSSACRRSASSSTSISRRSTASPPTPNGARCAAPSRAVRRSTASAPRSPPAHGEVGHVALDEPLALAQDAFRRFAADVVAPQAEAIHRHDLTVPESLLQPLREMGVFGLSIPERYGGSAPDDHEDTLMMLVVTEALSEARSPRPAA